MIGSAVQWIAQPAEMSMPVLFHPFACAGRPASLSRLAKFNLFSLAQHPWKYDEA